MEKIRSFFRKFIYGRYGIDSLGKATIVLIMILLILLNIAYFTGNSVFINAVRVFYILSIVLFFFRMLSRNTVKRSSENAKYNSVKKKITDWFRLQKDRFRDRKTHVYRKCPACKVVLRLKRIPGKHNAVCPNCGKSFQVNVR